MTSRQQRMDRWNRFLNAPDANPRWWHGRGRGLLTGTAASAGLFADDIFEGIGWLGGDGGGNAGNGGTDTETDPDTGVTTIDLRWVGDQAAINAGVIGQGPFTEDPTYQTRDGNGYLLQPWDLAEINNALAEAHGGATDSVASYIADNYVLFDTAETAEDLAFEPAPRFQGVSLGESAAGETYGGTLASLTTAAERFDTAQLNMLEVMPEVEEVTTQGKENFERLIAEMNQLVATSDGSETGFVEMLAQAMTLVADFVETANESNQGLAEILAKQQEMLEQDEEKNEELDDAVREFEGNQFDPGQWATQPGTGLTDPSELDDLTPPKLDAENPAAVDQATNPSGTTPSVDSPGLTPGGNAAGMSPAANMGGMDMWSSMLPMILSQAMMRGATDTDLAGRRADIDPSRYDRERAITAAPPAPPAAAAAPNPGATPWSKPSAPVTAAPAQTHTGPPSGATAPSTISAPPRSQNPDGSVVYTFPDGRTQKVSPTVADVLDKAFGNIKTTDAQEAYAQTPAKWTDKKEIGQRVDPYQLITGDVAVWDDRTAVLVVFGSGEEGTLEVVVDGELQPYSPEMKDSTGEFGQFVGFMHPPGIEAGGGKDRSADGAAATDQQSNGADMPIVAAPA
ncbi:hypothetical protein [Nocardia flavorosea]|uniref:Uncharacterized protein n=2 Tax=Nocardia flavorosea TaxID=53429 RepID=A0A846YJM4_9NOCA|nr:hypothetical protein [Nocardia flavorosea]NKY59816.1 hypothetical protein [Nocardia flavorosea]